MSTPSPQYHDDQDHKPDSNNDPTPRPPSPLTPSPTAPPSLPLTPSTPQPSRPPDPPIIRVGFVNKEVGFGLFAVRDIPAGQVIFREDPVLRATHDDFHPSAPKLFFQTYWRLRDACGPTPPFFTADYDPPASPLSPSSTSDNLPPVSPPTLPGRAGHRSTNNHSISSHIGTSTSTNPSPTSPLPLPFPRSETVPPSFYPSSTHTHNIETLQLLHAAFPRLAAANGLPPTTDPARLGRLNARMRSPTRLGDADMMPEQMAAVAAGYKVHGVQKVRQQVEEARAVEAWGGRKGRRVSGGGGGKGSVGCFFGRVKAAPSGIANLSAIPTVRIQAHRQGNLPQVGPWKDSTEFFRDYAFRPAPAIGDRQGMGGLRADQRDRSGCVYLVASLINHACWPACNAEASFPAIVDHTKFGGEYRLTIKARKDIRAGEELHIDYQKPKMFFVCQCIQCAQKHQQQQ